MPLGIVSDEQLERELEDVGLGNGQRDNKDAPSNNIIDGQVVDDNKGRGKGNTEIPEDVRKFIAEAGLLGASNAELSQLMDVSQSSVSAYKHGATSTSTYHDKQPVLVDHINRARKRVTKKAGRVLANSLDSLADVKFNLLKPKDVASIARNMAAIIRDMEPEQANVTEDKRVQFIMFAPTVKQESHFDAIDVSNLDND